VGVCDVLAKADDDGDDSLSRIRPMGGSGDRGGRDKEQSEVETGRQAAAFDHAFIARAVAVW
jgi:hypothetical protein